MEQPTHQDLLLAIRASDERLRQHDSRLTVVETRQMDEQEERRRMGDKLDKLTGEVIQIARSQAAQGGQLRVILLLAGILLPAITILELWDRLAQ